MKRPRAKSSHGQKRPDTRPLTRRQIWLFASGGGLALAFIVALVVFLSWPHPLTAEERAMLQQYESIRLALAQDDLALAQTSASQLSESFAGDRKIAAAARHVAGAPSLEAARDGFKILSEKVIPLARGNDGYFILGCPMGTCRIPCVRCPMARYSDWVQSEATTANPFLGAAGRSCGVVRN